MADLGSGVLVEQGAAGRLHGEAAKYFHPATCVTSNGFSSSFGASLHLHLAYLIYLDINT